MIQIDREIVTHVPVSSELTVLDDIGAGLVRIIFREKSISYLDKNLINGHTLRRGDVVRLHDIYLTNLVGQSHKVGRFWKLLRSDDERWRQC